MHKQHQKTMKAFEQIRDLLDQLGEGKINPQQCLFRIIQLDERLDEQTRKDSNIQKLIREIKTFDQKF